LAAYVEFLSSFIEFFQHAGGEVHIYTLNGLNHATRAGEKMGNFLVPICLPRDCIGRTGSAKLRIFFI